MKENSIEETKKQLELILKVRKEQKEIIECAGGSCMNCDPDIKALSKSIEILSDYKRVLKENERYKKSDYETICLENNELREKTDRIQSEYNDLLKDNFKLKNELETKRKEYQETYKDVREELKELKKENEELLEVKVSTSAHNRILELEKENEELKRLHIQDNKHLDFIMEHSIPVQKVKDKISERQFELQQEYKDFEDDAILIVLQELLEGRK